MHVCQVFVPELHCRDQQSLMVVSIEVVGWMPLSRGFFCQFELFQIDIFSRPMPFGPKVQKGIDKSKKSTRF